MGKTYTVEELEKCSKEELMRMLLAMRDQLERIPELMDAKGAIAAKDLEPLLPWSESLPVKCHKIRR